MAVKRIKIKTHTFDIERIGASDTFNLYSVIEYKSGDEINAMLGYANIKKVKEAIIKKAHSNSIEVSEKLREVGL